jgi:hypothetical protein
MAERRSLVAGLKPAEDVDPSKAKEFVFGEKAKPEPPAKADAATPGADGREGKAANSVGRVPLTIRLRADFGIALKRASLQRQIDGVFPHTLQDIMEEALEPWLRSNGYVQ